MARTTSSAYAPKRIILCFDGTWQTAVSGQQNSPSNITRLCRAIKPVARIGDQDWQQVVWYDSGVGTTSLAVSKMLEGAVGDGLDGNIVEAYNFVSMNWNRGDKILCFGFSRGAYTARAVAGLIADAGICEPHKLQRFPDLWKQYKNLKRKGAFYNSDDYFQFVDGKVSEHHRKHPGTATGLAWEMHANPGWAQTDSREVEVVAVYDTVQALGIPEVAGVQLPANLMWWKDPPGWHNVTLSRQIKHAFQALALDEYRKAFYPEVWCLPSGYPNAALPEVRAQLEEEVKSKREVLNKAGARQRQLIKEAEEHGRLHPTDYETLDRLAKGINLASKKVGEARRDYMVSHDNLHLGTPQLTQVWFPGYHINVGGGSSDTLNNYGDMEEMSNIVFAWMLDQIVPFVGIREPTIKDHYKDRQATIATLNAALEKQKEMAKTESWGEYLGRGARWLGSAVMHPLTPAPCTETRHYTWGLGDMPDSFSTMYIANGQKPRAPSSHSYLDDRKEKGVRGATCAYIHPVVNYRVQHKEGYLPMGLTKEQYSRQLVGEKFFYTLKDETLPEWNLGGKGSYELLALAQDEAAIEYMAQQHHAEAEKLWPEVQAKRQAQANGA
ncbi:hypothetical protein BO99DRAFT_407877 [Aspergillus violaceofuscus CBS 115571]|uniref:T6SS Phospholipase effector Tle1-like catalytic domain-containing protein n=1 Tax=Aspergillus violaceofuscus (strain CBS 115571) TaxID=1450538 RepID=A0A2V5GPL5_ASPV1|nr:hypothetical protein BO99DRAFT_407877 [Aspergillus violaceofuscus CBS 115571]